MVIPRLNPILRHLDVIAGKVMDTLQFLTQVNDVLLNKSFLHWSAQKQVISTDTPDRQMPSSPNSLSWFVPLDLELGMLLPIWRTTVMLMSIHVAIISMQVRRFTHEGFRQLQTFCNCSFYVHCWRGAAMSTNPAMKCQ